MMKNYFLILALFCLTAFWSCSKDEADLLSTDGTEQNGGNNNENGNNSEDFEIPEDMGLAFPDPVFRAYVLNKFDTDGDGKISKEEALAVSAVSISNTTDGILKSLDGIQYFINIISLFCHNNKLTSIDISKNTKLEQIFCWDNQLTNLDVSKNTALDILSCAENQLTSLDVSNNKKLSTLYCGNNQLTNIDVSNNPKLACLECDNNKLTSLDVSNNTALKHLNCSNNQIEELDLSKTDLVNSRYNSDVPEVYPLDCAPMSTLKKVYLKTGWSIKYITEDWNRSSDYIPNHTEIIFID